MSQAKTNNYKSSLFIIGLLFFVFGFITWLNGILIPFCKKSFELTDLQAYYVATAFYAAYFFLALPSSWILQKLGTKIGMTVGLVTMALGCLVFVASASDRSYPIFLFGLFVVGMGLALLQTAANPYVSLLGPHETAANRISIMGICNKVAGIIANLVFGSILLKNADSIQKQLDETTDLAVKSSLLSELAGRVPTPYTIMAIVLLIIAAVIYKSSLPDIKEQAGDKDSGETALSKSKSSIFQFPHVWLGALAIFFYVGAEVMAGEVITIYGNNLGFEQEDTKFFGVIALIGLLAGYILNLIIIPKYITQERWLGVCTVLGMFLALTSYFASEKLAVLSLTLMSFANAIVWPVIFPLGIKDVGGRFSNMASALLVMGIVGGAIIPPLYGNLYAEGNALGLDFRSAFLLIMFVSYAYILWYAVSGHKKGFEKI
jgi:FHS family L-fucose permease-like MFS transporter